jgi:hypothetical protein
MNHLDMKELLALASKGERSDHLDDCSFCSEQYQRVVDSIESSPDTVLGEEGMEAFETIRDQKRSGNRQPTQPVTPVFRLRRTWYFENNSMILRVIEDIQREVLTGFFISERGLKDLPRIHFDGIDREFTLDTNGVFEIGAASINIEPMNVTLLRL